MRSLLVGCLLLAAVSARADLTERNGWGDVEEQQWQEEEAALPPFPQDKDLLEFNVAAVASNRFLIDGTTIEVGKDGVVRYTLVVKTSGGATNVTREGIHCRAKEYRLYAMGRADGTWAKSRSKDWRRIENKLANRQHLALFQDYFCPNNTPILDADEGRLALRLGLNPRTGAAGDFRH